MIIPWNTYVEITIAGGIGTVGKYLIQPLQEEDLLYGFCLVFGPGPELKAELVESDLITRRVLTRVARSDRIAVRWHQGATG